MKTPRHIAFIMDGNGRWARRHGLPRSAGHKAGYERVPKVLEICDEIGVVVVSCFAWSTENWDRPAPEVNFIQRAVEEQLPKFVDQLNQNNVRFKHSGDLERLSEKTKDSLRRAEEVTCENGPKVFNLVFNYGGRSDILRAAQKLMEDQKPIEEINADMIAQYLWTSGLPDVDLVIRTGGDQRISNFLLWQSAFAPVFIVDSYWPDISRDDIIGGVMYYRSVMLKTD